MKKALITILLVLSLALSACAGGAPEKKYKRISFADESFIEGIIGSDTEVDNSADEKFPSKITAYEIAPAEISEAMLKEFAAALGVDGELCRSNATAYIESSDGYKKAEAEGNALEFSRKNWSKEAFTVSEGELISEAKKIFESLPLEGEYECIGITEWDRISQDGETILIGASVTFVRLIDGIRVLGGEMIDLKFDSEGLYRINCVVCDYKSVGKIDLVPLDDALSQIKKPDAFTLISDDDGNFNGAAQKLTVDSIKMVFINNYSGGYELLQPVYSFNGTVENSDGKTKFNARVIAIPEKYTYD